MLHHYQKYQKYFHHCQVDNVNLPPHYHLRVIDPVLRKLIFDLHPIH